MLISVSGFIGSVALNAIGNMINPPYGVRIAGTGLFEWGMVATILVLIVAMYWDGVRLGRILDDRMKMTMPDTHYHREKGRRAGDEAGLLHGSLAPDIEVMRASPLPHMSS